MDNKKAIKNLIDAYEYITNEKTDERHLAEDCLLSDSFNELIPYMNQVTYFKGCKSLTCEIDSKYEQYIHECGYHWSRRDVDPPCLYEVLVHYPKLFDAFKYVLENWSMFYSKKKVHIG